MQIPFHPSPAPTLGVEWELALVDQRSRDLVSAADVIFADIGEQPGHRVHKELLRNTVELVTGICQNVGEAMADLSETMATVRAATDRNGIDLYSAGMHPFAEWQEQELTASERYETLIDRTQWWGRQMLIYGIHVHVGMPERDRVLPVLNSLLRYFPHMQALSASSPFYASTNTGYASNRALMFQQLPTAGLPFQFATWQEYEYYVRDIRTTGVIDLLNEIRWDIRPSPALGTIEVRVCDAMATFEEVEAVVALIHCLIVDLDERLARGETLPVLPPWHVQENKWRSARYGMDSIIILDGESREELVIADLRTTMRRLEPMADRLNCLRELSGIEGIIDKGAGYQRQREVAAQTNDDLRAVVDNGVAELRTSHLARLNDNF
jgi:carboxylate-amine ligase